MCHDPDAPGGDFVHWLVWDIPGAARELDGSGAAEVFGTNDFGRTGYGAPCPPTGVAHHYVFELTALDVPSLGLQSGSRRPDLEHAIDRHVLGRARLTGSYKRE